MTPNRYQPVLVEWEACPEGRSSRLKGQKLVANYIRRFFLLARLPEDGIHLWFQRLKNQATKEEWDLIHYITFHDLRHDFAHRAREAGWSLEEIAYYLGHITNKGTPAIQTTIRYTQVSREQVKEKLKDLKG